MQAMLVTTQACLMKNDDLALAILDFCSSVSFLPRTNSIISGLYNDTVNVMFQIVKKSINIPMPAYNAKIMQMIIHDVKNTTDLFIAAMLLCQLPVQLSIRPR